MSELLPAEKKLWFFLFILKLTKNKTAEKGPPQKDLKEEGLILILW